MRSFHTIPSMRGSIYTWFCRRFRKNIRIGEGLRLCVRLEIKGPGKVTIGNHCTVSGMPGNRFEYVTIYTHSPEAVVSIGDHAVLLAARISSRHQISIGDHVLIEESGIADTDFHSAERNRALPVEHADTCRIRIGDRVSIGCRSIIQKGVSIGDGAVVCPGSVVARPVPASTTVIGNPARRLEPAVASYYLVSNR